MTKWDTIQADVADQYTGIEELIAWEDSQEDLLLIQLEERDYLTADDLFDQDDLLID
jgi:hypothetical protein